MQLAGGASPSRKADETLYSQHRAVQGDHENDLVSGRRILRTWMMPVITRRSADALPGSAYLDRVPRRLAHHLTGPHAIVGRNC
jgi:hypothetical protein